ncbi:hypothetical protein BDU57DRAFT_510174 [Ampelomyces quisqualis]|uniref:Uncharacterized protein n=1 Tax=Ampelomyces quisqualis TaxID=50730 RepID=A0A6A5R334_AMPQU|nr:hypothetical protein BDU57DRAFT_510174 [Ampelomyces quisqualis]
MAVSCIYTRFAPSTRFCLASPSLVNSLNVLCTTLHPPRPRVQNNLFFFFLHGARKGGTDPGTPYDTRDRRHLFGHVRIAESLCLFVCIHAHSRILNPGHCHEDFIFIFPFCVFYLFPGCVARRVSAGGDGYGVVSMFWFGEERGIFRGSLHGCSSPNGFVCGTYVWSRVVW